MKPRLVTRRVSDGQKIERVPKNHSLTRRVTSRRINRRRFLRGAGVTLALPFLTAWVWFQQSKLTPNIRGGCC